MLERRLEGNQFVVGEELTIADFSAITDIAQLNFLIKFKEIIEPHKNLQRWYSAMFKEQSVQEAHETLFKLIKMSHERHGDLLK